MIDTLATLTSNAEKTDEQERPTADSLRAAREAGGFALVGRGATEAARLFTELGRGCPSTSWIAGACLTGKTLVAATVAEVPFAAPDTLVCGSGTPTGTGTPTPDGVRVTGRWANVSGCEDAEWAGLGVVVDGVFSFAAIPTADLTIERTWKMAGMRGTGSHTVVATDVLVPAGRIGPLQLPGKTSDMLLFGLTVLGPVVGGTFGALDVITRMFASDRKPFMSAYTKMGESPGARHWLAEATRLVQRAERTMLAVAAEIDAERAIPPGAATPAAGTTLTSQDGVRLHVDLADAARDCRAAVDLMLDLHGASGFATGNPLQRFWRDVNVASRHPHLNPYLAVERSGALLAGDVS
ncbi:acyl-CoA dehydrogenase [Actinoplanes sp. NPDC049265]|uniref:acyl-CoA dehydrogenase n=1 Tax=Actinoplanes sp. NPDC049265 TaxID=3363902 RepID=UPI0037188D08